MFKYLNINKDKGFTLIELLVTIAIFLILSGAVVGLFVSGAVRQRSLLTTQTILDQSSFSLELMTRALRMAKKELGQGCLSGYGLNYELTRGGLGIQFINALEEGDCQEFYLDRDKGQIMYRKERAGETLPLTSDNRVKITRLTFNLIGEAQGGNPQQQPRVTILLEGEGKQETAIKVKMQTTISQRNLDVER